MTVIERKTVFVPKEKVVINQREIYERLGKCPIEQVSNINECMAELEKCASYKYCYLLTDIVKKNDGILDLGFGEFKSDALTRNLNGCSKAYIFAATIGVGVDRLLSRMSVISPAKQFVTDALASSMIESLCDYAQQEICGKVPHKPRFSPGYGDLDVAVQPKLLHWLEAEKHIGITLSNALLMIPTKSVTAIIGVKNNENY